MTDQPETTNPVPPQPTAAPEPLPAPEPVAAPEPLPAPEPAAATEPVPEAVELDAWALSPEVAAEERARRPRRRIKVRWAAAALVVLLTGTAAAFAVTSVERTDLPGLETPNDGRYVFQALTLPPLPSGAPSPGAAEAKHRHHADLRMLVLPAPVGATVSPAPAPGGAAAPAEWKSCDDYAQLDKDPVKLKALLDENACRGAVHRAWTGADGTRAETWLLQFGSETEAGAFHLTMNDGDLKEPADLAYAPLTLDPSMVRKSSVEFTKTTAGAAKEPVGRAAYVQNGDVVALVVLTNPKGVPTQAFRQVAILQNQLLN
ncbi:hypothetical protein KCMC57_up32630 [Kitasatospora sp. CMC57]|uniref:DUF5642 domain-containing protein n=1 Tax=Kitasatospora sp. CMC57 TaxID=3231513 RepID=A0AB33JVK7_9ACTN